MEYRELLHRCFRCGWCKYPMDFSAVNCPSYLKHSFETYSPGGRLWLIRGWKNKEIEATTRFREIVYSCATCKNCTVTCGIPEIRNHIADMIIEARQEMVSEGKLPAPVRNYFMEVYNNGNPFRKHQSERGNWAAGLDIPDYGCEEYLFYAGDEGSFDETAVRMTRAAAILLKEAGVSFGILRDEEICDGNDAKAMGEKDLFLHLAEKNIQKFKERGIKKIITLSPHAFNAFKNDYPASGGTFEVFHYTEILVQNIAKLNPGKTELRVTYHDPCYLGRWNNHYTSPRQVLQSIPGIKLTEMGRSQAASLCCGGGGGNYYTDMIGSGPSSPSRVRVREAADTGAEVIAVSCPICYKMLDDAVKDEGLEKMLRVMDIAQVINESKIKKENI